MPSTATSEVYTLSLHDALPICCGQWRGSCDHGAARPAVSGATLLRLAPDGGVAGDPRSSRQSQAGTAADAAARSGGDLPAPEHEDRKSTRLNSSHLGISYAVYCYLRGLHSFPTRRSSDLLRSVARILRSWRCSTGSIWRDPITARAGWRRGW